MPTRAMAEEWPAFAAIYIAILVWAVLLVLALRQVYSRGGGTRGRQGVHGQLDLLDEACFQTWHWRGRSTLARTTHMFRCAFFAVDSGMMAVNLAYTVWQEGLVQGVARTCSYLTNWGTVLASTYFGVACLYQGANGAAGDGSDGAGSAGARRVLVRLHAVALTVEVTIFFMWLIVTPDTNLHQHVLAPGLIVADFFLGRIPVYLRDMPLPIMAILAYLPANYTTTRFWFVVYAPVNYETPATAVYIGLTLVIVVSTFAAAARLRRKQLSVPQRDGVRQADLDLASEVGRPGAQVADLEAGDGRS